MRSRLRPFAACLAPLIVASIASACGQPPATSSPSPNAAASSAKPSSDLAPATSASASTASSVVASASASVAVEPPPPPPPRLSTTRVWTRILDKPAWNADVVGYVRAGAKVERAAEKTDQPGCAKGWYALKPAGFVCDGAEGITTDLEDPAVTAAASFPPDVSNAFPYGYGTSQTSPFYTRIPTPDEMKQVEGDVAARLKDWATQREKMEPQKRPPETAMPLGKVPAFLGEHAQPPNLLGWPIGKQATLGSAWMNMRLSFVAAFEAEGRNWYLTTENLVVPADRIRAARLAEFHGIELASASEAGEHLPIAWVRTKDPIKVWKLDGEQVVDGEQKLPFQAHVSIADKEINVKGQRYLEITSPPAAWPKGARWLVKTWEVARVDAQATLPAGVAATDAWMDVSLSSQSLVYYEGTTPTFATLISSGAGEGHGTPSGLWRVYVKHVSSRMESPGKPAEKEGDKPENPYRVDDVPWVQYFVGGYALHAAYWHDDFGQPRSHGCINLSPRDARTLFNRTAPAIPVGWHGVVSGRGGAAQGTWVRVRW
jgi:lipoprotein-anchoring transpeptidase ErfK/SrfK